MKFRFLAACLMFSQFLPGIARCDDNPEVIAVWPGVPPGSEGKTGEEKVRLSELEHEHIFSNIHRPTLTVYLPNAAVANGCGVLVIPGGGHREIWMDHEGYNVGHYLAEHGIAAFVLKYRLAKEEGSTYQVEKESLADVQRAMQLIHSRATAWKVDPARLGLIGFSAGGELAALGAAHIRPGNPDATDPIEKESSRPAFQGLIYPGNPTTIQPTKESPPAFLLGGYNDSPAMAEGLGDIYLRFRRVGVPAELHVYAGAGHGFGLRANNHKPVHTWPDRFCEWLGDSGFLGAQAANGEAPQDPAKVRAPLSVD